jgi:hypothetical protein
MAKTVPCSAEKNSLMAVINSLFAQLGNFARKPLILRGAGRAVRRIDRAIRKFRCIVGQREFCIGLSGPRIS